MVWEHSHLPAVPDRPDPKNYIVDSPYFDGKMDVRYWIGIGADNDQDKFSTLKFIEDLVAPQALERVRELVSWHACDICNRMSDRKTVALMTADLGCLYICEVPCLKLFGDNLTPHEVELLSLDCSRG